MTKPFDIEAARRGDQVQTEAGTIVRFIGQMSDGRIVYERAGELRHAPESVLRMAPRKRTLYIGIQSIGTYGPWFSVAEDADDWVEEFPATRRYIPVEVTE